MCGIVAYIGHRDATPILIEGLKRLEYRGYDSAGVAVVEHEGVQTRKRAGKLTNLQQALADASKDLAEAKRQLELATVGHQRMNRSRLAVTDLWQI